jgi:imidazolonepropionase-like amidohydrolase
MMKLTFGRTSLHALTFALLATPPWNAGCQGEKASFAPKVVGCPSCTVLQGGMVFDGTRAGVGTVVIDGDRVKDVVFGEAHVGSGTVVDVTGKTVLPGLVDLHVHLMADASPLGGADDNGAGHLEDHLKAMLRAGVTSYLDLGSSAHVIFEYRRRIQAGEMLGPRLFAVGPLLTPTGGHPCYAGGPPGDFCIFVDAPADAAQALSQLAPQKPDFVKIVIEGGATKPLPRMTEPSMAAIEKAAEKVGIPVIAHVAAPADVADALTAGVTHFAHLPMEHRITPDLAQRMAAEKAVVVPTVAVVDGFYRVSHGTLTELQDPKLRDDVPAEVIAALRDPKQLAYMTSTKYQALTAAWRSDTMANLKACWDAGVTIAAGTDAGNPGTFHGLALARELALYVEAGIPVLDALATATRTAADVLGRPDLGRLEPGALADVVVVDGDATTDIGALSHPSRVYRGGELVDRAALALPAKTSLVRKPTTNVGKGGTCLAASECASHLTCDFDLRCVPTCNGYSGCATGSACVPNAGSSKGGFCYPGDGCDPIAQDCENGAACTPLGNGATACLPAGNGSGGQACSPGGSCATGSACSFTTNTCLDLCDPSGARGKPCPSAKTCADASSWAGVTVGLCQ